MRRAAWLLLFCGCSAGVSGPPNVDVGGGADQFITLRDGDSVPIIHGLQGGYHVWGSVRASGVDPNALALRFTLYIEEATDAYTIRNDTVDLSDGEHLGTAVFLPNPDDVRGRSCRFHLDVTDAAGRTASSEHRVTPN